MDPLLIVIITVLSIIQSLFGVGLLVFGTPILLLLNYSFPMCLLILLPCSITISLIQVVHGWNETKLIRNKFLIFIIPTVVIGSAIVLLGNINIDLKKCIAIMLLIGGLLRLSQNIQRCVYIFFRKWQNISFALIGLIHGMTNMGGGPLTILSNALFVEKDKVRANISLGYLIMASTQLAVLLFNLPPARWNIYFLPIISGCAYLFIGNKIFKTSSQFVYQHLMTVFILLFGFVLIVF